MKLWKVWHVLGAQTLQGTGSLDLYHKLRVWQLVLTLTLRKKKPLQEMRVLLVGLVPPTFLILDPPVQVLSLPFTLLI